MNKNIKDLTGNVYDRLMVIGYAYSEKGKTYWNCYCSCDDYKPIEERKIHTICGNYMKDGSTSSCGCKRRERAKQFSRSQNRQTRTNKPYYKQLKNIWRTLIHRCHNPEYSRYRFYGAKGVYVCEEWKRSFDTFYEWAMEHGYTKGLEINRLDQTRNYMPDNCEWMPKGFSCGNTSRNILVTIGNKTQSLASWSRDAECEVSYATIRARYHKGIKGIALIKKEITFKDLTYRYKKKTQTFKEWSLEFKINLHILEDRFNRDIRGEKLFRKIKKAT